ncbi:MAG: ribosome maturation factor RimP [Clostridiales bacterium]|nr:ribosome maturation factor RimP [Clostridiales bacterium]
MSERIVDKAEKVIRPVVEELGYVFVDLEYRKDYSGNILELTIDNEVGININDCERVSRALDIPLDENDVTDGRPYNFNVSSYGLDRNFKTDYDFNKHIGKVIDIKFYAPYEGKKLIIATLVGFDKNSITISLNDEEKTIERKLIANICAHIEF